VRRVYSLHALIPDLTQPIRKNANPYIFDHGVAKRSSVNGKRYTKIIARSIEGTKWKVFECTSNDMSNMIRKSESRLLATCHDTHTAQKYGHSNVDEFERIVQ
jgi:hypothetical protein